MKRRRRERAVAPIACGREESTSAMGRQKQHLEENTAAAGGRAIPAVHSHKAERTIPSECMFDGGGAGAGGGETELFFL